MLHRRIGAIAVALVVVIATVVDSVSTILGVAAVSSALVVIGLAALTWRVPAILGVVSFLATSEARDVGGVSTASIAIGHVGILLLENICFGCQSSV